MSACEVAIVGAGPYGLSITAHLVAKGVSVRLFGRPMRFWREIADAAPGRYLKSFCFGTDIALPSPEPFAAWNQARGGEDFEPCAMADFASYGEDLARRIGLPEQAEIMRLEADPHGYALRTETGETVRARSVVIATGLSRFAVLPEALAAAESARLAHTATIRRYADYAGQRVAVIGGGQSALEAAALLAEAGAEPELIVRRAAVSWMTRTDRERGLAQRLRRPLSGLGAGPKAWLLTNLPGGCRLVPDAARARFLARHLPPEGAWWLRERVEGRVPIRLATRIAAASVGREGVRLTMTAADGGQAVSRYDAVVAGTGFRIDLDRLDWIAPELRAGIARIGRAPRLSARFETSLPGLYVAGPASAASFGPLFRFVVGAGYTARRIARDVASEAGTPRLAA